MDLPNRKPTRLKEYDYSTPGAYFITICTKDRREILSHIVGAIHESPENTLTQYGQITKSIIEHLPHRFNIEIPNYVIMPNHLHLIVVIKYSASPIRAIHESPLPDERSLLSKIIGYLKMNVSKEIHQTYAKENIWQRGFHDHIIRNEKDFKTIYEYIETNVIRWEKDCFFPHAVGAIHESPENK